MPFIPNYAAASHVFQAAPDSVDFDAIVAAFAKTGVLTGCAVTQTGAGAMSVDVAVGTVSVNGVSVPVVGITKTIGASDPTNDRIDIVTTDNLGVVTVTAGTAAAVPLLATIPANSALIAAVYVQAATVAILTADIIDKRIVVTLTSAAATSVVTATATYAMSTANDVILADATSAAFTITLPTAIGAQKTYSIKKINSNTNWVTVDGFGTETVDGSLSAILKVENVSITLASDGSNWRVI